MSEQTIGSLKTEVDHIKGDIVDIKINAKEQGIAMLSMRDSNTETRIYINQIRESQNTMAKETRETIAIVAKDAKENQKATMEAIQTLKDAPHNSWKQMSMAWKIGAGMLIISYIVGSSFSLIKSIASMLAK